MSLKRINTVDDRANGFIIRSTISTGTNQIITMDIMVKSREEWEEIVKDINSQWDKI